MPRSGSTPPPRGSGTTQDPGVEGATWKGLRKQGRARLAVQLPTTPAQTGGRRSDPCRSPGPEREENTTQTRIGALGGAGAAGQDWV